MSDEISVNMNVNLGKGKTVDDIVTVLREHLKRPEMMHTTHWEGCMESHTICALAWSLDEIQRLREKVQDLRMYAEQDACEIERLRATVGGWSQDISNLEDRVEELESILLKSEKRAVSWDIKAKALEEWADAQSQVFEKRADEFTDVQEFDIDLVARLRLEASNEGQLGNRELQALLNEAAQKIADDRRQKTNIKDTIANDSVKGLAEYLHQLSDVHWLSDQDARQLERAAHLLLRMHRDIGIKDAMLKSWDFMLNEAKEQSQQAHRILGSEPFVWVAGGTSNHEQSHWDALMPYIQQYWAKYGNVMRPKHSS